MQGIALSISDSTPKVKKGVRNSFPTINRYDIMEAILSVNIGETERVKLSNMYSEILNMEKCDLKYIDKITVSSNSDSEIYDILNNWKSNNQ